MSSNEFDEGRPFSLAPSGAHNSGLSISSAQTITIPDGATKWIVQTIDQNVRYTLDGTTPTTSSGFRLTADRDPIVIPISPGTTLKVIEETGTADLEYQFAY